MWYMMASTHSIISTKQAAVRRRVRTLLSNFPGVRNATHACEYVRRLCPESLLAPGNQPLFVVVTTPRLRRPASPTADVASKDRRAKTAVCYRLQADPKHASASVKQSY